VASDCGLKSTPVDDQAKVVGTPQGMEAASLEQAPSAQPPSTASTQMRERSAIPDRSCAGAATRLINKMIE
jgi:hypothetical protein